MPRDPFTRLTARPFILDAENVDTDQIIPARFLTTTAREGLGQYAFHDWRAREPDRFTPDAVAARPILVTGENFGCGSSREHAPWALLDLGFRAVLAPSFADIFRANALKNGLVAVEVPETLVRAAFAAPDADITVDLEAQIVSSGGTDTAFTIDPFARRCILDGVDEMGFLLAQSEAIDAFEAGRP